MTKDIRFIVTADDYGLSKEVDKATLEAIRAGSVSTVTVLMNFKRSEKALKKLITTLDKEKLLDKIGIGVHLNICTGYPIIKDLKKIKSIVNNKEGHFRKFDYFKTKTGRTLVDPAHALCEVRAQIDRFIKVIDSIKLKNSDPVYIDHLTSQNNILHQIPKLSEVIAKVAVEYQHRGKHKNHPIPVRRPIPMLLEYNEDKLVKGIMKYLSADTKKYLTNKVNTKLIKGAQSLLYRLFILSDREFNSIMKAFSDKKVRTPHAMFFSFYASPTITKDFLGETEKKVDIFKASLPLFWHVAVEKGEIDPSEPYFIEIVHHLSTGKSDPSLDHLKKISKLDVEYLESHSLYELNLVKSKAYQELLQADNVPLATYSDLNAGHTLPASTPV